MKNKSHSFLSLLMSSFFTITIVVFVGFAIFYLVITNSLDKLDKVFDLDYTSVLENKAIFESGNYQNIDLSTYLTKEYQFCILDDSNKLIYTTKIDNINFNKRELEMIPNVDDRTYYIVNEYKDINNKIYKSILHYQDDIENETMNIVQYAKLNQNNEVIHGDLFNIGNIFTDKELQLLSGIYNHYSIKKMNFNQNNKIYTAIFLIPQLSNNYEELINILDNSWKYFVVLYLALNIISLFILNKKIKRLLNPLNEAILASVNQTGNITKYHGPIEFEEIVNNFNYMQTKLKESEEKRIKLDEDKIKMLSNISHDIKTPVTAIVGYSTALLDGTIDREDQYRYIETINNKALMISSLVNEFSEYSKINRIDNQFNFQRVEICEFTRELLASRYIDFENKEFELVVKIPDELLYLDIDPLYFTRAINNLIDNSLKYNKANTCFCIEIIKLDSIIEIRIKDNGKGIDSKLVDNIFEPFIMEGNQPGSMGLGLSIVKNIIEKHNGKIQLIIPKNEYSLEFVITMFLNKL